MATFDDDGQQTTGSPAHILPYFDDFNAPQLLYEYTEFLISSTPSPQSSLHNTTIPSSPSPQSSCSNTQSSSTFTESKPLRNRTCWVYKHMPDPDIRTKYYSTTSKLEWRCKYCSKRYTINRGTRLIKSHLHADHGISELSIQQERSVKRQMSIQDVLVTATSNPQKRRRLRGNLEETDFSTYIN